jgi:endonuclease/exonuclease/phosphatase (EEP) superfamily protein YafD
MPQIVVAIFGAMLAYSTIVSWKLFARGWQTYISQTLPLTRLASLFCLIIAPVLLILSSHSQPVSHLQPHSASSETLTIGTFNKLYTSQNFVSDTDFLLLDRVDVISLQEVNPVEVKIVADMLGYEYTTITECGCSAGNTDVALVSRYPIIQSKTIFEHNDAVILRSELRSQSGVSMVVYTVHMYVPISPETQNQREEAFDKLATSVNAETGHVFVAGDFNTTVFSPLLRGFARETQVSLQGAYERNWPRCSWFGFGEVGCVRIDHVFVPRWATVHSISVGDQNFSDHRAVVVELSL